MNTNLEIGMKNISINEARIALANLGNVCDLVDVDAAYFTLEEFISQQEHFIRTRGILVPMLLQAKKE